MRLARAAARPAAARLSVALLAALPAACGEATEPPSPIDTVAGAAAPARPVKCDRVATPSVPGSGRAKAGPVQALVDSLEPGEIGCLRGGVYDEDVTVTSGGEEGAPIRLRSAFGERAVLRGRLSIADEANFVRVEQLVLDGSRAPACEPDETCEVLPSPSVRGNDVTFWANEVRNGNSGICFNLGGDDEPARRVTIKANRIHHCGRLPRTNFDHGVYVQNAEDTRILSNWIYANADRGVKLSPNARESEVRANVIDGNGVGVSLGGDEETASSDNEVSGNVISNSRARWNVETFWPGPRGDNNVIRRNCVFAPDARPGYATNGGITVAAEGLVEVDNLVLDPDLADPEDGDLAIGEDRCRERVAQAASRAASRAPPEA